MAIEPAVAVPDQLDGHGVDPRVARLLTRCESGQLPVIGAGQMLMNVPDLCGDQVEVVEQPFCRGRDELPGPDIVCQGSVRVAQHACVVVEPGENVTGAASRARVQREARREGQRPLFQALDAEQLVAKRFLRRGRCAKKCVPELPEESVHRRIVTFCDIELSEMLW